ncbi:MAG: hypothetical protein RBU21_20780 [FCB group bacterium]|jgi:hypothetical protein|nr:hypothetical protein [FCB group bacterium]
MKRIIRVFPRRTRATPIDDLAAVGRMPELFDEADEVHVSVAFTWDLPAAEMLARQWSCVAPVRIGGPATGEPGGDFAPGMYLRPGYVITSRGCPNRCWFCSVWKREGNEVRELPIRDGWNVLDDNLLACSDDHIRAVFAMLERQPEAPQFTGGLEAKLLKPWHAAALRALRPKQLFFAYDTDDDLEPLREAGRLMLAAGFTTASHALRCYVLCGWPSDTTEAAERRMHEAMDAGFTPMAMAWRGQDGKKPAEWAKFQREWARPAIVHGGKR